MKIYPISSKAISELSDRIVTKPLERKTFRESRLIFPRGTEALINLERRAEQMAPADYIKARNYLAQQMLSYMKTLL